MTPGQIFIQQATQRNNHRTSTDEVETFARRQNRDRLDLPKPTIEANDDLLFRLQGFLLGKLTWAQVEGWSAQDLYAYATVGSQLFRAGKIEEAKRVFEGCEAINSKDWYFPYCLAQIHIVQGDYEEATACLKRSIASPLQRPEPYLLLAGCALQQGDEQQAVSYLEEAKRAAAAFEKLARQ